MSCHLEVLQDVASGMQCLWWFLIQYEILLGQVFRAEQGRQPDYHFATLPLDLVREKEFLRYRADCWHRFVWSEPILEGNRCIRRRLQFLIRLRWHWWHWWWRHVSSTLAVWEIFPDYLQLLCSQPPNKKRQWRAVPKQLTSGHPLAPDREFEKLAAYHDMTCSPSLIVSHKHLVCQSMRSLLIVRLAI